MKQFIVIGQQVGPTATLAHLNEDGNYVGIASGLYTALEELALILNGVADAEPQDGTVEEDDVCELAVAEPGDVDMYMHRRPALDFAIQRSPGSLTAESIVKDAAAFEDYLRNGATK